jgi:hypothetical protein
MSEKPVTLNSLDRCGPGHLIRINLNDRTEWAIVGKSNSRQMLPVLVLTGESAPYFLNVVNEIEELRQEYERPVLSYGHSYTLNPDHIGPCDVNSGPLFELNGVLIVADSARVIRAPFRGEKRLAYYDIDSGQVGGEPGGARAAFGRWLLRLHQNATGEEEPVLVAEFSARSSKKPAQAA